MVLTCWPADVHLARLLHSRAAYRSLPTHGDEPRHFDKRVGGDFPAEAGRSPRGSFRGLRFVYCIFLCIFIRNLSIANVFGIGLTSARRMIYRPGAWLELRLYE